MPTEVDRRAGYRRKGTDMNAEPAKDPIDIGQVAYEAYCDGPRQARRPRHRGGGGAVIDGLLQHPGVRAVQFAADLPPGYDVSLVKAWTEGEMWHG